MDLTRWMLCLWNTRFELAGGGFDSGQELGRGRVGPQILADRGQCAVEMILDGKHVAREPRRRIIACIGNIPLHAPAHVLDFCRRVQRFRVGVIELLFEFANAVMLGHFGRGIGRLLAKLLRLVVKLLFVLGSLDHAINLVSAFAVKSTMGTTRA